LRYVYLPMPLASALGVDFLRKGVADIPLRAQVSQEVNNRFMDTLSTFSYHTPLTDLLAPYVRGRAQQGRRVRALDISGKDRLLLHRLRR
jgi:hypothetical protein